MGVFAALRVFFLGLYLGRVLDHVMATGLGTQILDFLGSTAAGNVILALIAISPLLGWLYRGFLSSLN
jgi:hypothetical protein